jgi:hypothetical protein
VRDAVIKSEYSRGKCENGKERYPKRKDSAGITACNAVRSSLDGGKISFVTNA